MIAGVLIGPSVLGHLAPEFQSWLFPKESVSIIYCLSQIGLVLYMFLVGLEFDRTLFRRHVKGGLAVSFAGVALPFALGALFALATFSSGEFFTSTVSPLQAAIFLGAAMSITAFPMLARIIKEKGLAGTSVGVLALAAGASDDAVAWCALALVLSCFKSDPSVIVLALGGGAIYALIVLKGLMPLLARHEELITRKLGSASNLLAATMTLLFIGAWFTDAVGIYAVFGAFIMGVAIPRGQISLDLKRDLEPLASIVFLPLFFIYSGLNTRIELLLTPTILLYTAIVVALACIGKGAACAYAAYKSGQPRREALMIGALMNARGLMELILLSIGVERGIITPTLFAMMVLMAIVTTLLASPVFFALQRREPATMPSPELASRAC
jgi:Kef-type K+ transport system membrane component KefB